MSFQTSLILGSMLILVTLAALMVRKLVWSLILLFYSSIVFGLVLIADDAVFAGLFHIITFAGALSVLFMVILMAVGGPALSYRDKLGKENFVGMILAVLAAVPLLVLVSGFQPLPSRLSESLALGALVDAPQGPLGFLWALRSWDILLVIIVVSAAMLGVVNLFSREAGEEK